jgi:hypothetical protein
MRRRWSFPLLTKIGEWAPMRARPRPAKAPHSYEGIKFLCTLLTTLTVIVGSILALSQASNWAIANEHDQYTKLSEKWLELDKFFFAHHELRKYFYEARPVDAAAVSPEECSQAISAAYYTIDFMDYILNALYLTEKDHSSSLSKDQRTGWTSYFRQTFLTSPLICTIFWKYPTAYSDTTRDLAVRSCAPFFDRELPQCPSSSPTAKARRVKASED